jgi:hypothetical protein
MNTEHIRIDQAILHILDSGIDTPVLSDAPLQLDGETGAYLEAHVARLLDSGDTKACSFSSDEVPFYQSILELNGSTFVSVSRTLAQRMFSLIRQHPAIPAADVVFLWVESAGTHRLMILKMNFRLQFMHYVDQEAERVANRIVPLRSVLPPSGGRVDEAVLVNMADLEVRVLEKSCEINGERGFWLSSLYLGCEWDHSPARKMDILTKTAKKMGEKYADQPAAEALSFKKAVAEVYEETGEVAVETVLSAVYQHREDVKREFREELGRQQMSEPVVKAPEIVVQKKMGKQKLKTDTGIEISIPIEQVRDGNAVEFINNPDGTISILIKNVNRIR